MVPRRIRRLPMTKARHHLGAVVKWVHLRGRYVVLEKSHAPVAALMGFDEFEVYLEFQKSSVRSRH